jgi:hypothetical protein
MDGRMGRTTRISIETRSQIVCVHGGHNFPPFSSNLCSDAISTRAANRLPSCRLRSRRRPTAAEVGLLLGAEASLGPDRRWVPPNQPPAASLSHISMHFSAGRRCACHRIDVGPPFCRPSPRHQPPPPPTARSALVAPHRETAAIRVQLEFFSSSFSWAELA